MILPDKPLTLRVRVPRGTRPTLAGLVSEALDLSLPIAEALVAHGSCRVDGRPVRQPELFLTPGQLLDVRYAPSSQGPRPEVLHADESLLVVNKPAGMPVQPTDRGAGGTLVEQLRDWAPLHVVHRLDHPVSGIMVLARSAATARSLTTAFESKQIRKVYAALPEASEAGRAWLASARPGTLIDRPLTYLSHRRKAMVDPDGKPSRTELVGRDGPVLLLRLHTGRTHQIRIHLSSVGLPILGDGRYGAQRAPRIGLHSFLLAFVHPVTGDPLVFTSPPPEAFFALAGTRVQDVDVVGWGNLAG